MIEAISLEEAVIHLGDDGTASTIQLSDDFWSDMDPRLERGRMVSMFPHEEDWKKWEMHPEGDEIIHLLSGRMTLILEQDGNVSRVSLDPGQTAIVPKGVWHTADVPERGEALYITPGANTAGRPR